MKSLTTPLVVGVTLCTLVMATIDSATLFMRGDPSARGSQNLASENRTSDSTAIRPQTSILSPTHNYHPDLNYLPALRQDSLLPKVLSPMASRAVDRLKLCFQKTLACRRSERMLAEFLNNPQVSRHERIAGLWEVVQISSVRGEAELIKALNSLYPIELLSSLEAYLKSSVPTRLKSLLINIVAESTINLNSKDILRTLSFRQQEFARTASEWMQNIVSDLVYYERRDWALREAALGAMTKILSPENAISMIKVEIDDFESSNGKYRINLTSLLRLWAQAINQGNSPRSSSISPEMLEEFSSYVLAYDQVLSDPYIQAFFTSVYNDPKRQAGLFSTPLKTNVTYN